MPFKYSATLYKQKAEVFFVTGPPSRLNLILVFGFYEKGKKGSK